MEKNSSAINILKFLASIRNEIFLVVDDLKIRCFPSNLIDDVYLEVEMDLPAEMNIPLPYGISCLVPYGKDLFFFPSEITKVEGNKALILVPAAIQKRHEREYERYNVEGVLFCSINLIKNLGEKGFEKFSDSFKKFITEYNGKLKTFDDVVSVILEELRKSYEVATFIEPISQLPWLSYCRYEHLGLVVNDISSGDFLKPFIIYGFATYGYFLPNEKRHLLSNEVKFFINYHSLKGVKSFLYYPLFLVDTLLGYIFLGKGSHIDLNSFSDLRELLRIVALADIAEQFFCYERFFNLNEHKDLPIPVVDISFGGIKVKIDKHIACLLDRGDKIKVFMRIGNTDLEFLAEVIRIGYEKGDFVCASKFLNMDKEKFTVIKKWFNRFERW
jgi:hypothetical protein